MASGGGVPHSPRDAGGVIARDAASEIAVVPALAQRSEADRQVVLHDGACVRIRRSSAADGGRVAAFYGRMSPDPVFQRFVAVMEPLVDWTRLAAAEDAGRCLLLAEDTRTNPPDLVAVASCESAPPEEISEVALLVRHDGQDRGLGTILFEALLEAAEARGIRRFRARVLAANHRMLDMLERCAAVQSRSGEAGVIEIVFTRPPGARPAGTAPVSVVGPATRRSARIAVAGTPGRGRRCPDHGSLRSRRVGCFGSHSAAVSFGRGDAGRAVSETSHPIAGTDVAQRKRHVRDRALALVPSSLLRDFGR